MLVKGYNQPSTREDFINAIINSEKLVIVEGKKDVAKLKKLGVKRVVEVSQSLCSFAEKIAKENREVILLMDNDKEGRKLFSSLVFEFSRLGVKVDRRYQKMLANLKVSHVEGL